MFILFVENRLLFSVCIIKLVVIIPKYLLFFFIINIRIHDIHNCENISFQWPSADFRHFIFYFLLFKNTEFSVEFSLWHWNLYQACISFLLISTSLGSYLILKYHSWIELNTNNTVRYKWLYMIEVKKKYWIHVEWHIESFFWFFCIIIHIQIFAVHRHTYAYVCLFIYALRICTVLTRNGSIVWAIMYYIYYLEFRVIFWSM